MIQIDMIWYDMLWRDMICINEMNSIKSWNVVFVHASNALYQLYNLYMSHHETIHSRHILQLTLLASICVNIAVRTISNNETCGVLNTWLARNKLQKLRTHHANWHRIVLLLQRCWFCCADSLHCCTLSATLCVMFLFLLSCNKQYAHRTVSPPGKTYRWWPSSQAFR